MANFSSFVKRIEEKKIKFIVSRKKSLIESAVERDFADGLLILFQQKATLFDPEAREYSGAGRSTRRGKNLNPGSSTGITGIESSYCIEAC